MLSPFFLLVAVFYLVPTILTVLMSFTDMGYGMKWHFIGMRNFSAFMNFPFIGTIIRNTFVYVVFTLICNVGIGFCIALLTVFFMDENIHSRIIRTIWMLPRITPSIVLVIMWAWFFSSTDYGFLNKVTNFIGLEQIRWLSDHAMLAVITANTFIGISFAMLIFTSAMQSLPNDIFLAAEVDGSKKTTIIFSILLPAIKWPVMFVTIVQTLALMTSYETTLLLTNGGPVMDTTVWSLYAYKKAFNYSEFGHGAALSLVLVSVSFTLTLLLLRFFDFDEMMKNTRL